VTRPFLTAEWRHLALLNFEIEPGVLAPLVPAGTELDTWQGRTFVSMVGFLFLETRVLGVPVPFHRAFEEVNLRFYVKRRADDGWRRGVVFVKEIVPRRAVALLARLLYGENYATHPMEHTIEHEPAGETRRVSYRWAAHGRENRLELSAQGPAAELASGSLEEFLAEQHWGYTRRRDGRTSEYRVDHPRWHVRAAASTRLDCEVTAHYGSAFVEPLSAPPASAFLADGSEVAVFRGEIIPTSEP